MSTPQEQAADLRARQRPLKDRYREDPATGRQTSTATARVRLDDVAAEVPQWSGTTLAGLHPSTGGNGSQACSGDMLLEALAGCVEVDGDADEAALARLVELTERYCVVAQTLRAPTPVTVRVG